MTEYPNAVDEMYKAFNDYWIANSAAVAGYVPEIRWHGKEKADAPEGNKFWVRVSTKSVFEEQISLSSSVSEDGRKRYTGYGLVFVQLFCPKSVTNSIYLGRQLAQIAKKAYRGKSTPSKIWFRNVRINELDAENVWYRFNIISDYQYDEIF